MEIIKEIGNKDVGETDKESGEPFRQRAAARAVLLDDDDNVAIIEAKNIKIHKIIGGGIEEDEDIEKALEREIMEESGCIGDVKQELGIVIEHRSNRNLIQTNYCYIARLVSDKGQPSFTEGEIEEGFELVWVSLDEAERRFATDEPTEYSAKFQQVRDSFLLKEARKILETSNGDR